MKKTRPPAAAEKILQFLLPDRYALMGDYEEYFNELLSEKGRAHAVFWYWLQIFVVFPSFLIDSIVWSLIMVANSIKLSLRILKRQGVYSALNILGLSVGIACFILISLYVTHELSYEQGHENRDRIYRVVHTRTWGSGVSSVANSPVPLGAALKEYFPGIENSVRFWRSFDPRLRDGDTGFAGEKVYFTDPDVFKVFTFDFISGNPENALSDPNTVVLTRTLAEKFFGTDDPTGKTIEYKGYPDNQLLLTVTGVIDDLPDNTHVDFDALVSLTGVETEVNNWGSIKPVWVYVMLPENVNRTDVETSFPGFVEEYIKKGWKEADFQFRLEPIGDIHLRSMYSGGFKPGSGMTRVYTLSAVGILILLIACINFMNLSTALSQKRGKEIGMRKVLGTSESQIIRHFLTETIVYCVIAGLSGIVIAAFLLPTLNILSGLNLSIKDLLGLRTAGLLTFVIVVSGLLSGAYPAFYLSGFRPAEVLQKRYRFKATAMFVRKGLIVFQFIASIVLIICTLTINGQLQYMQQKDLGFNRDNVVVVPYAGDGQAFMHEIKRFNDIAGVTVSTRIPANISNYDRRPVLPEGMDNVVQVDNYIVDWNYISTYDMTMATGRNFSEEIPTDNTAFIINESAVNSFGWESAENSLGMHMNYSNGDKMGAVIGVVKDFHLETLESRIGPLIMQIMPEREYWKKYVSIKIRSDDTSNTLNNIETTWRKHAPESIYSYFFVDESYRAMYADEDSFGRIFMNFASLSIMISCLGLFGISLFTAENRTKEIGIRKTLGASSGRIVFLLSKSVLKWISAAFVIACPIAAYIMQQWLSHFAYRIDIEPTTFVSAGFITLFVALITISFQSVKAANTNPVNSLRYE